MQTIDYVILLGYLAATLALGLFFANRNRTSSEMFTAGGRSPWWVAGLSSFMTMFSAGTFVIWGGIAYKHGLVAIMINMTYGLAAFAAGYLVAGRWKASGVRTPAEYIELRYGSRAARFYATMLIAFRLVDVSITFYALAVVLSALMPLPEGHLLRDPATGHMSTTVLACGFGAIVILYTVFGGLWAVLMTDVLQFVILNLSVIFVLLLTLASVDFGAVTAAAPHGFFLPTTGEYGWLFLAGWCTTQFFIIGGDWAFAQRFLSVQSPRDARRAGYLFGGLYLVSPWIWLAPPLLFGLTHPGVNPEQAYILAGQAVLPAGMVGLMVAAMFSATASTVSGYLNVFAAVLTNDAYRRIFRPNASERELVIAGRIFSGIVGLAMVILSIVIPRLGGAERIVILWATLIVGPLMAPTIWGLLSPRITTRALWIMAAVSFAAGVLLKVVLRLEGAFVDVFIGVILPVLVLAIAHACTRRESEGWKRAAEYARGVRSSGTEAGSDITPAFGLAISMIASGLVIICLVPFSAGYRASLGGFGIVVTLLGIAVWLAATRIRARDPHRNGALGEIR